MSTDLLVPVFPDICRVRPRNRKAATTTIPSNTVTATRYLSVPVELKAQTTIPQSIGPRMDAALPANPYNQKNSPTFSGGDSSIMKARLTTQTPPIPIPAMGPTTQNRVSLWLMAVSERATIQSANTSQ